MGMTEFAMSALQHAGYVRIHSFTPAGEPVNERQDHSPPAVRKLEQLVQTIACPSLSRPTNPETARVDKVLNCSKQSLSDKPCEQ